MQIPPLAHEPAELRIWRMRAAEHLPGILASRQGAITLLAGEDVELRSCAIWSFVFHWGVDRQIAGLLAECIENAEPTQVRSDALSAVAILMLSPEGLPFRDSIRDLLHGVSQRRPNDPDLATAIGVHLGALEAMRSPRLPSLAEGSCEAIQQGI